MLKNFKALDLFFYSILIGQTIFIASIMGMYQIEGYDLIFGIAAVVLSVIYANRALRR